jgi:protein-glutamine gamma-glutamyltransferase
VTRQSSAPATARHPAGAAAAATTVLVAAGAGGWSGLLGTSLVRIVPAATAAVLLAAGGVSRRVATAVLVAWLPAAVLAAGVPAGQLLPDAWPRLMVQLAEGAGRLTTSADGSIAKQPWPLAAWLLGTGAIWVAGAALTASRPSAPRRAIAFAVLASPWIAAVILHHPDRAAWQGAAVLLAGVLWSTAQRLALRRAMALGLAAALVSGVVSQAVGPQTRWFIPAHFPNSAVALRFLETEPTYGPLQSRRSGATMLEVTAAQPALWRMRVLTLFFGHGWRIGNPLAELPEPAAERVEVTVRVRGLGSDLVVAPGRIDAIHAAGRKIPAPGEAWQLAPTPRRGDTYQIRSRVVHATAQQLRSAPAPTDPRLYPYTHLAPGYDGHSIAVPLFGKPSDHKVTQPLDRTPYGPVAALARQLTAGARTQWDVVARVHRYLLDGGRFRYTTSLPQPGQDPLADFLLRDHAGDCQHFAGAAALLLRLAGVPTRVVTGFATGVQQDEGRFAVRDVDAHFWIEVYFQGYGWVAFNPTPTAAQANIPGRLDPLTATTTTSDHGGHGGAGRPGWLAAGAILAALATAGVRVARRRPRRALTPIEPLLEGLVRRAGGRVQPSSTLAELAVELTRLVGPNTAALAAQAERARFASDPAMPARRPRIHLARTLTKDLGLPRALIVLLAPRLAGGGNGPRQHRADLGESSRPLHLPDDLRAWQAVGKR